MTSMDNIHPVLTGEKIILRPVESRDANDNYLSWLLDEQVMSGIATSGYTLEKLKSYVEDRVNKKDIAFYAICSKQNQKHIGNVKLDFHDAKANVSELGLLIGDRDYWGKGIGFEACHLLMQYGFGMLNLRKIYLAVYENNPHAKKLYEKLGYRLEGVLRKHVAVGGVYYDKYLMGIFKEEFK